jgi:hypothetical protein
MSGTDAGPGSGEHAARLQALMDQRRYREALNLARELHSTQPDNVALAGLVVDLEAACHWSMLPLWPTHRFGQTGAVVMLIVIVVGLQLLSQLGSRTLSGGVAAVVLLYLGYSWVWPKTLRKMLARPSRGG